MADTESHTAVARAQRFVRAEPAAVYRAFIDPALLSSWLPPPGLTCIVHEFEPRAGGRFRMSLVNAEAQSLVGEAAEPSNTVAGRILALFPDERVVEIIEFASSVPAPDGNTAAGEMTLTIDLNKVQDGTDVRVVCSDIPLAIDPEATRDGWAASLEKLAALIE